MNDIEVRDPFEEVIREKAYQKAEHRKSRRSVRIKKATLYNGSYPGFEGRRFLKKALHKDNRKQNCLDPLNLEAMDNWSTGSEYHKSFYRFGNWD